MRHLISSLGASCLTSCLLASGLVAQDIDRLKRPELPPAPTFKFPKIQPHTLANGVRVLVVEDHSIPLVAVRAVVGADSTLDPIGKEGLYALTLATMREGTAEQSPEQLAESFADIGATVTPTGFTTVSSSFASGLTLMSEMLKHPALDQVGIDRRKTLLAATARRSSQTPSNLPRRLFNIELYGLDNGYVRSLAPTEPSISAITRDDIVGFHDRFVRPQLTTLIVAGDVTDANVVAVAQKAFADWPRGGEAARPDTSRAPVVRSTAIYLSDTQSPQAYLYVGGAGPSRAARDFAAADVMGAISGSRMVQTLRERRSFIYSGNAGIVARRAPTVSTFIGSASVSATKVDSALVEWLSLLKGLRSDRPVTDQELEATRRNRIGLLPARTEGPDSLATRLSELIRDNVPLDYYDRYAERVATITPADVATSASKYIDLDHLIIVITGDRKVIEPALRAANLAPVVIVDANGNPLP